MDSRLQLSRIKLAQSEAELYKHPVKLIEQVLGEKDCDADLIQIYKGIERIYGNSTKQILFGTRNSSNTGYQQTKYY